ncbi:MAG: hypothetical protein V3V99_13430 [candidate division Zixibacteria bacterium]
MLSPIYLISFCAIIAYTYGQYTKNEYREYFKNMGLGTATLILFYVFTSSCPGVAVGFVLRLLLIAIAAKFVFWVVYRMKKDSYRNQPGNIETGEW